MPNVPVQRRAAQRTVRCNRLLDAPFTLPPIPQVRAPPVPALSSDSHTGCVILA